MAANTTDLDLSLLASTSGSVGMWALKIVHKSVTAFSMPVRSKPPKAMEKLNVHLVSAVGEKYITGQAVETPQRMPQLAAKWKVGEVVRISKVAKVEERKEYIGSPLKVVIDLKKTSVKYSQPGADDMPRMAQPPDQLCDILNLSSRQYVDVTVLVLSVSAGRSVTLQSGEKKTVQTIKFTDGSKGPDGLVAEAEVEMWFAEGEAAAQEGLKAVLEKRQPISLFNLSCAPDSEVGRVTMKCSPKFWWASAHGDKAEALKRDAASLTSLEPGESVAVGVVPEYSGADGKEYLSQEASQCCCGVLDVLSKQEVQEGVEEKLFQLNWVLVVTPGPGATIATEDGARIWVPRVTMHDWSGEATLGMRERAALRLANADNKEDMERMHADGSLGFPAFASIRVAVGRREEKEYGVGTGNFRTYCTVVEAEPQDITAVPTQAATELQSFLKCIPRAQGLYMIGYLEDMEQRSHQGFVVRGQSCAVGLCLVKVTRTSLMMPVTDGFQIVTEGAESLPLESPPIVQGPKFAGKLVSLCTMSAGGRFQLTPQRGRPVVALIMVSAASGCEATRSLFVHYVEVIPEHDVEQMRKAMSKLRTLGLSTTFGEKRERFATTPSGTRKARKLSRAPTSGSMTDVKP